MSPALPSTPFDKALGDVLREIGLEVSPQACSRMGEHYRLLQKWNRGLNLTRITSPQEAARRHFGESLLLSQAVGGFDSLADIGSGGGFPGMPIAAVSPESSVSLIESVGKKATFLNEVTRDWQGVHVIPKRAEDVAEQFDWIVMRAVKAGPLLETVAGMAPRLGLLAGQDTVDELQASERWTWKSPIPLPWGDRRFILIGKRST